MCDDPPIEVESTPPSVDITSTLHVSIPLSCSSHPCVVVVSCGGEGKPRVHALKLDCQLPYVHLFWQ